MPFKETETLELKKSTSELKEAIISISAMLNKHGRAEVIFGVSDDGAPVGQTIGKKTLREISSAISSHIEPKVYPKISEEAHEGNICVRVAVEGAHAPYYAYSRAYMRTADEDRPMGSSQLEAMILGKNREALRWDDKPCQDAKLGDIDHEKLRRFLNKAHLESSSTDVALRNLGLSPGGKLTNAAVLLFGRAPQKFMRNAQLRCAVFTNAYSIIDQKDYEGDLFLLIEEAQSYILKNIHIGERMEGLYRADVPEISQEAFREAIINAFCHRDYYNPQEVQVAIFPDRLEIRSPGRLYGDLTIASIRKGGVSARRNPLIARMLHRVHFIEKWGRGIPKILSIEPGTEFKEVGQQFITVFKRKNAAPEKIPGKLTESPKKVPGKSQEILDIIISDPAITRAEIAQKLGVPPDTIQSRLRKLIKDGLLKHVGPKKGGKWEVIQPPG